MARGRRGKKKQGSTKVVLYIDIASRHVRGLAVDDEKLFFNPSLPPNVNARLGNRVKDNLDR